MHAIAHTIHHSLIFWNKIAKILIIFNKRKFRLSNVAESNTSFEILTAAKGAPIAHTAFLSMHLAGKDFGHCQQII